MSIRSGLQRNEVGMCTNAGVGVLRQWAARSWVGSRKSQGNCVDWRGGKKGHVVLSSGFSLPAGEVRVEVQVFEATSNPKTLVGE